MPIDDAIIDARMESLKTKLRILEEQRRDLTNIEQRLMQVRTVESITIGGEPPIKSIPIDNQTGIKFTPQRRQAIFDQGIVDADTALV